MAVRWIEAVADSTARAKLLPRRLTGKAGIAFKRDTNTLEILDPDGAAPATFISVPLDAAAAGVATPVAGVAAGYKVARGVSAVTGTLTVVTGLATVVAVTAVAQTDLDGDALAGVSATIGDQAGTPAAGSVILKAWKVTTGGAAGNPTLIAATGAADVNWVAIGT